MEPNARYTLIGASLIGLVIAIVVAVLWISRYNESGQFSLYSIYFKEHSLSGLQVDSDVTMRGIRIGNVESWEISPRDIELVKVIIRAQSGSPIKKDTRAVINRNLLTGIANIDLIGSSQHAEYLTEVPAGEIFPIIPEGQGSLESLKSSLPEMLEKSGDVLVRLSAILSEENAQSITTTLKNIAKLSEKAATSEGHLETLLSDISGAVKAFKQIVSSIDERTQNLSRTLQNAADAISQDLDSAAKSLSGTLEKFQDPRALFVSPDDKALAPGEKEIE